MRIISEPVLEWEQNRLNLVSILPAYYWLESMKVPDKVPLATAVDSPTLDKEHMFTMRLFVFTITLTTTTPLTCCVKIEIGIFRSHAEQIYVRCP